MLMRGQMALLECLKGAQYHRRTYLYVFQAFYAFNEGCFSRLHWHSSAFPLYSFFCLANIIDRV